MCKPAIPGENVCEEGGVFIAVYFVAPLLDYKMNSLWRNTFDLYLEDDVFRVTAAGKTQGFEKPWENVTRVLENENVYILFFGSEQEFFIIPKQALKTKEIFLQGRLARKINM